jgi:pyruvate/2-oxoglutarate dehydrogenase complex dihydrolipoamide dehydrogenase (E3) component
VADREEFDVIVLGAGPVGENVADRVVKGGLSAAVVESELVGGECSYWACMPSKALIRPAQALAEAAAVDGSRQAVTAPLAVEAVLARRDSFTSGWDDAGQVRWLDGAGITLVRGHARLAGPRVVEVDGRRLQARHAVVVTTGSDAQVPPIPGLADAGPWTSREATSAHRVPDRLLVLGGGVVGCEMAQAWSALGSEVTLVERSARLLGGHEPFAGEMVAASMRANGIKVHLECQVVTVERSLGAAATVMLDDGTGIEADEVLVAMGRTPRTGDIGLESVGLEPGSWLTVDDSMRVTEVDGGWLYAAGDVNHRALLTHQGKYQARVCGDVIVARAAGGVNPSPWDRFSATADQVAVPAVVFTDPEVAGVGLTEARARAAGVDVRVVEIPIAVAGSSLFADGYEGRACLVVDEGRRVVVGATFVGRGVAEMLHSATVAVVGEVPLERLWHAVPSYPTISEVWLRLLEAYGL